MYHVYRLFVFFKQKTAYDMRISDWSSDVCSSDLLGVGTAFDEDLGLVGVQQRIASGCLATIDCGTAFDQMHVAQPPAGQRQPSGFIRVEQASEQPCVLMQAHRAIGAVGAGDPPQPTTFLRLWVSLLLVAGCNPGVLGKNPDLQEMGHAVAVVVELRMGDAAPGAHALNLTRNDHGAIAHGILVGERALNDIADDFHVAMAMGAETLARLHAILVDHSQRPPMHVLGVVVVGEREAVPGVEPAVIGVATFMCGTQGDHGLAPQAVRRRLAIRLSRLYWPAPCAASTRNPPAMAMFFIRRSEEHTS